MLNAGFAATESFISVLEETCIGEIEAFINP